MARWVVGVTPSAANWRGLRTKRFRSLYGPDLPKPVLAAFQQKVIDCGEPFTSGDSITVGDFARHLTRSHHLEAGIAAEEFYKLALDCGLDSGGARSVRDAVKTVR